jgi:bla regulator protein blaR1
MLSTSFGPVADHLWQSTLVVAAVALLALVLRRNRAEVRHALWMAASIKFLIPFAALMALGQQLEWREAPRVDPTVSVVIDSVGRPFSAAERDAATVAASPVSVSLGITASALVAVWALGTTVFVVIWVVRWRGVARMVREATPVTEGRVIEAIARVEAGLQTRLPARLKTRLYVVSSDTKMEPGVFGIGRPVLVWPRGIEQALTDAQVDAILNHELAHVQRRDNVCAALHMAVQAIFWFHPIVWWVGTRLVDERERACDEAVVRAGSEPHVYAEGILKTVQHFVESPLPCVAGVTGSDLKKRIEQIMRHDAHHALNLSKRVLLSAALLGAVAGPIGAGALTGARATATIVAPGPNAPTYDVTSIRPNNGRGGRMGGFATPSQFTATGLSTRRLIRLAYDIHDSQITGGPDWIDSQGFDVDATIVGDPSPTQRRLMTQTMLRDRFRLSFHTERREMPVYALVVARGDGAIGKGLRRTPQGACLPRDAALPVTPSTAVPRRGPSPFDPNAQANCGSIVFGPGRLLAHGVPIDMLVRSLASLPVITAFNRIVKDETGLEGTFDFDLKFAGQVAGRGQGVPPPVPPPGSALSSSGGTEPPLVTALREQLGLNLDARTANVEVLVIDSMQRPREN